MQAREQFGNQAHFYATNLKFKEGAAGLIELLDPRPDAIALDVGTGAGHTAHAIARRCRYVLAGDVTPEMLAEARQLGNEFGLTNVQAIQILAENLPAADGSLDAMTCRLAAHHFRNVPQFCREAIRSLKSGGLLAIEDVVSPEDDVVAAFVNDIEVRRDHSHAYDLKASEWRRALEEAGFSIELMTVLTDASKHELYEWTERAATPASDIAYIRDRLAKAPASVNAALSLQKDGETFRWSWHTVMLVARKP